jgi:4-amino-4-deoxy-L-arabinose transferase-like glycosyltransferase
MRRAFSIICVLLAFVLTGSLYAIYTPDWQAPDEPAHYNYIRQLSLGRFPVIEPGDYDQDYQSQVISSQFDPRYSLLTFQYEDYQPPLYYLLLTPVFLLFDGALHPLRIASVALGAVVVLLTFLVARKLFPDRFWLVLTATVFVAFLPQHVAMLSAVNNDSLAELIIASIILMLLLMVQGARGPTGGVEPDNRLLLFLGIIVGLGLLTKATVYMMVPIVAVALGWVYWGEWNRLIRAGLLVFGSAMFIGLIWWARNALVYDGLDVLGVSAHNRTVTGQPLTVEWIADRGLGPTVAAFFRTTFQSFWGQFGWMGVVMPQWVYRPLLLFSILTIFGFGWSVYRWRKRLIPNRSTQELDPTFPIIIAILLGTFALSLLGYLAYNITFVQHQGRYLFSALIPISLAVATGWALLLRPITQRWPRAVYLFPLGLAIALFTLDLIALFKFIVPGLT